VSDAIAIFKLNAMNSLSSNAFDSLGEAYAGAARGTSQFKSLRNGGYTRSYKPGMRWRALRSLGWACALARHYLRSVPLACC